MIERTVKLPAYTESAPGGAAKDVSARDRDAAGELARKQAQLDDERNKSLELFKTIAQLRESLKQEQARSAELESKLNKLMALEESQFARSSAQIEAEKKRSLELERTIKELQKNLEQEQARSLQNAESAVELEARRNEITALQAQLNELSGIVSKIAGIAEAAKVASDQ